MVARLLNVKSSIGKELDSLADMVSFGFLPGVVMFMLLKQSDYSGDYVPYLGFIITVFSALRLAKFNVDTRQTEDFIGLNTPMNTLFVVSLPFIKEDYPAAISSAALLLGLTALLSWLLVSEIRIFSFKMNSLSWGVNKMKYLFLIISTVLVIVLQFSAVPFILALYIGLSILHYRSAAAISPEN
jgi:CDP-diacylglycerol--serine O-phosphatidyltransferase